MTIIPEGKLKHDPQRLLYHFPSIDKVRYTKLSQEYYYWHSVSIAEDMARKFGKLLIPARCLHWERKAKYADRRIQISKNAFFIMGKDELTPIEKNKYLTEVQQIEEAKEA